MNAVTAQRRKKLNRVTRLPTMARWRSSRVKCLKNLDLLLHQQ